MKKLLIFALAVFGMLACSDRNAPSDPSNKEGLLPGKFSVSATRQVQFSMSNLQYHASDSTWRFAENQYDFIGTANKNIDKNYDGWIDMFGWGTGNNPTLDDASWSSYNSFVEWGVNKIINGGQIANQWRTLTSAEWAYLFLERPNSANLFGLGCVNAVNGIIVLPDSCKLPEILVFKAGGDSYTNNVFTAEQWTLLEIAGAIFLPASGYRVGKTVHNVGTHGAYWSSSSTPAKEGVSFYLDFDESSLNPQADDYLHGSRHYGHSVRLVQEVR